MAPLLSLSFPREWDSICGGRAVWRRRLRATRMDTDAALPRRSRMDTDRIQAKHWSYGHAR